MATENRSGAFHHEGGSPGGVAGDGMSQAAFSPGEQAILTALGQVHGRLDRLEARIGVVEGELRAGLGIVGDSVDQEVGRLYAQGVDVDARLRSARRLLIGASAPEVTEPLLRLLDRLREHPERLQAAISFVEGLPGLAAMTGDTLDGFAEQVAQTGTPLDTRIKGALALAEQATRPESVRAMQRLLDRLDVLETLTASAVFEPHSVDVVGQAGKALVETREAHPAPMGLFGALSAVGRPDIQRALGFLIHFGERFGRALAR